MCLFSHKTPLRPCLSVGLRAPRVSKLDVILPTGQKLQLLHLFESQINSRSHPQVGMQKRRVPRHQDPDPDGIVGKAVNAHERVVFRIVLEAHEAGWGHKTGTYREGYHRNWDDEPESLSWMKLGRWKHRGRLKGDHCAVCWNSPYVISRHCCAVCWLLCQ